MDLIFGNSRMYLHNAEGMYGAVPLKLSGDLDITQDQGGPHVDPHATRTFVSRAPSDSPPILVVVKPQLQIRAGAEKSTDTLEINNRYRTLGINQLILCCAVAVAMLIMCGSEH